MIAGVSNGSKTLRMQLVSSQLHGTTSLSANSIGHPGGSTRKAKDLHCGAKYTVDNTIQFRTINATNLQLN